MDGKAHKLDDGKHGFLSNAHEAICLKVFRNLHEKLPYDGQS
jgi:hypothetical protein